MTEILPLVDYPGHLARVHLLANWDSLSGAHEYYAPNWRLLPNLALEMVSVPLAKVVPATLALRVFTGLALAMLVVGGAKLNRAVTGEWSVWAFAPMLLLYNKIFAYGFLNYIFGLGLALLALAIHIDGRNDRAPVRLLRGIVFSLLLLMCHLVALGIFLIAAVTYDIGQHWAGKRLLGRKVLVTAAPVLLALVLMVLLSPTGGGLLSSLDYSLGGKPARLWSILNTGQNRLDWVYVIALGCFVIGLWVAGCLSLVKSMRLPVAALVLVYLLAPFSLGETSNLDTRLPIAVLFVMFAAFRVEPPMRRAAAWGLATLLLLRIGGTAYYYWRWSDTFATLRQDLKLVPDGSMLFMGRSAEADVYSSRTWNPPLVHGSALALLDQNVYVADLFTNPTQQPLVRTERFKDVELESVEVGEGGANGPEAFLQDVYVTARKTGSGKPVYVYLIGNGETLTRLGMEPVVQRGRYGIYRVQRSATNDHVLLNSE